MSKQDDVALIMEVCKTAMELLQRGMLLEAAGVFGELELRCITLSHGLDGFENNLIKSGSNEERLRFIECVIDLCEEYVRNISYKSKWRQNNENRRV